MKSYRLKNRNEKINICTFFANIPTFIYLLPIPVLQHFLFDPQSFREKITSYSLSIILFFLVGGFSAADYRTKRYKVYPNSAHIKEGIFIRSRFNIPYSRLQSVILQSSPFTLLFSAVKIQLNTSATKAKKGDAELYLSCDNAKRLISEIYDDIGYIARYYRAKNSKIFLMASIWSNPISGLLIISPIINNIGKIVGEELKAELIESFDLSKYFVYIGVPPTAAFIAYTLLVCYAVSVFTDFFHTANFTCTSYQNGIVIKRGILKKTLFLTNPSKLNAVTINQSIFMIPIRLCSAYIYTVGAGKAKGDKSLLIAAERKNTVKNLLRILFPNLNLDFNFTIKPVPRSIRAYLRLPLFVFAADIFIGTSALRLGIFENAVSSVMVLSIPLIIVWCLFRIKAFSCSALSLNESFVYIRSYRRITLKSTIIPISKIQLCVKRVSIFGRYSGTCNIRIYIYGEKRTFVDIKHLNNRQADAFIKLINNHK